MVYHLYRIENGKDHNRRLQYRADPMYYKFTWDRMFETLFVVFREKVRAHLDAGRDWTELWIPPFTAAEFIRAVREIRGPLQPSTTLNEKTLPW